MGLFQRIRAGLAKPTKSVVNWVYQPERKTGKKAKPNKARQSKTKQGKGKGISERVRMISTKGRYALRVMIDLAQQAQQDPGRYVPLAEIAERQQISKKYLEIIVNTLVKNGLLEGLRGKGGGYKLTREPQDYTVGEVLELAEGSLAVVACLQEGAPPCGRKHSCDTLPLWERLDDMIRGYLSSVTLKDLMEGNCGE